MNGVFSNIQWLSSDENIASIDKNGIIYGKLIGDCNLNIILTPFEGTPIERIIKIHIIQGFNSGLVGTINDGREYPIEIYNIQGLKIMSNASNGEILNLPHGIYIKRQGDITEKFIIK